MSQQSTFRGDPRIRAPLDKPGMPSAYMSATGLPAVSIEGIQENGNARQNETLRTNFPREADGAFDKGALTQEQADNAFLSFAVKTLGFVKRAGDQSTGDGATNRPLAKPQVTATTQQGTSLPPSTPETVLDPEGEGTFIFGGQRPPRRIKQDPLTQQFTEALGGIPEGFRNFTSGISGRLTLGVIVFAAVGAFFVFRR